MARKVVLVGMAVACLTALYAPPASADKYDLKLARLYKWDPQGHPDNPWVLYSEKDFENLMWDMGTALAPRFLGPGCSLGSLGFQIATNFTLTDIPENSPHWQRVMSPTGFGGDPAVGGAQGADSCLRTFQFNVRKGLPFSAELGGSVTKLMESGLWGVGLEVKYSALEGFKNVPEIGFRSGVSTFLGTKDYAILLVNWDAIVSKKFGVAGLFKVAPYAGYNGLFIHGSSNVILTVPPDNAKKVAPHWSKPQQQVFPSANIIRSYAVIGIQLIPTVIDLGFELAVDLQDSDHRSYSFRFGVDF